MEFAEHGHMTKALSKLAYDLGMATFAAHALEQSRKLQHDSEKDRISKAKTNYDDLVRAFSKAHRELDKLENMAFWAYVDAVPDADRTDFPSLSDVITSEPVPPGPYVDRFELPDPETRIAKNASDKQDDGEHEQNP